MRLSYLSTLRQKWTTGEYPSQTAPKQFQSQGWLGHSQRREKAAAYPWEDCQEPAWSRTKTHLAAYKPENLTASPTEAITQSGLSILWHSAFIIFTGAFIPLDIKGYSCSLQTIQENNINNKIQRKKYMPQISSILVHFDIFPSSPFPEP